MKYDISKYYPCDEAVKWYNKFKTSEEAWEKCPRGDWMLWIAHKLEINIYKLTTAKYLCANTVRHLMKDQRSIDALEAAKLFGQKKIGKKKLKAAAVAAVAANVAATAAYDAAYAAYADAAKQQNQQQTADICRKVLTKEVFNIIKEKQK